MSNKADCGAEAFDPFFRRITGLEHDAFSPYVATEGYKIRFHLYAAHGPVVFTFESMAANQDGEFAERPGWGARFLRARGANVIAFIEEDVTRWYRDRGFWRLLRGLEHALPALPAAHRIAYGSSKGGYAAAAFAGALGCDTVLLFNPISTLNPALVPWEKRFGKPARHDWSGAFHDAAEGLRGGAQVFVVVDPLLRSDPPAPCGPPARGQWQPQALQSPRSWSQDAGAYAGSGGSEALRHGGA